MFDYLIVGAGLFGSVFAHEAKKAGKKVLVVDKRGHIGGNCYTVSVADINVHRYGAHIFHTGNEEAWRYINQFAVFNNYVNSPIAVYQGRVYNLPFNMNTFNRFWGVLTPAEAQAEIERQVKESGISTPRNLEEQAISLVGTDIYTALIKDYTEKQWGKECKDLPADIIRRLPLRFTYDNNYFSDRFQGIPIGGYTQIFERLLEGCEVSLNTDFLSNRAELTKQAETIIYTGAIDGYYDYRFGMLEYRSLEFESATLDCQNFQGNAVVNYTGKDVPYTRIIEHKHFEYGSQPQTVVTYEYPKRWSVGDEPYYTINDEKNLALYQKYLALSAATPKIRFGGRLGQYKYLDMDQTIIQALTMFKELNK